MAEEFTGPNDRLETEPPELGELYIKAITLQLAKQLAVEYKKPWTEKLEGELQGRIAELIAAAKAMGLTEFVVVSVTPTGSRARLSQSVEKISKTRKLQ